MVLLAKDIMDKNLLTMPEATDALTCARRMVEARKGYAVVLRDGPGKMSGIVTEWDLVEKVLAKGIDPAKVTLREISSPTVHACGPDTPTDEVVTRMASLGVRRIIVRSGDQVVGIVTSRHVLAIFRQYIDKLSAEIAGYHSQATPLG
jgi:CBS domain-containing protein